MKKGFDRKAVTLVEYDEPNIEDHTWYLKLYVTTKNFDSDPETKSNSQAFTYVCMYTHIYIYIYIHLCVYVNTHIYIYIALYCVHSTYTKATYIQTNGQKTDSHAYIHTYTPTYLPTRLPACPPAYLPTCLPAYLQTNRFVQTYTCMDFNTYAAGLRRFDLHLRSSTLFILWLASLRQKAQPTGPEVSSQPLKVESLDTCESLQASALHNPSRTFGISLTHGPAQLFRGGDLWAPKSHAHIQDWGGSNSSPG